MIQTIVEERFRGRVMGFYTMAIVGMIPIGSLLAGVLAERVGAPATIRLGGLACLVSAVWFAYRRPGLRKHMRTIYLEQGIIGGDDMTGHDMRADRAR